MSGESEAKLRSIFQEAAAVAPCIVFIGAWVRGLGWAEAGHAGAMPGFRQLIAPREGWWVA